MTSGETHVCFLYQNPRHDKAIKWEWWSDQGYDLQYVNDISWQDLYMDCIAQELFVPSKDEGIPVAMVLAYRID
jgi:hypothetical protein